MIIIAPLGPQRLTTLFLHINQVTSDVHVWQETPHERLDHSHQELENDPSKSLADQVQAAVLGIPRGTPEDTR